MIDIAFDEVFNIDQLRDEEHGKLANLVSDKYGLFFFFSKDESLLYIGWSRHLRSSIGEYLVGRPGNAGKFYSDIYTVKILYSDSFDSFRNTYPDSNDIQFYLIDKLNPRFNVVTSLRKAYVDSEQYIENQYKEWEAMKVHMKPISVLAHFDLTGKPRPYRFTYEGKELRIDKVISVTEERLAGNRMLTFRCQSEINGEVRPFELKYELLTCKWLLWKM